jgi:hypothetical protein
MKRNLIGIVVIGLALGGAIVVTRTDSIKYEQVETIVEKTVEVETLQKRIDDAITASSTDIELKAKEAYEETKKQAQKTIELEVRTRYENELKAKRIELEKETKVY